MLKPGIRPFFLLPGAIIAAQAFLYSAKKIGPAE
jgi:hypothetical protein